jgi:hypothetical protein
MYWFTHLFLPLLLSYLNCGMTTAQTVTSLTTFPTSSIPTSQTIPAAPTQLQQQRCTTNATCLPDEFCYDPDKRSWLDISSSTTSGICLGKPCHRLDPFNTEECRSGQKCTGLCFFWGLDVDQRSLLGLSVLLSNFTNLQ